MVAIIFAAPGFLILECHTASGNVRRGESLVKLVNYQQFTKLKPRVESESDDLDYLGHLGHFFGRSNGFHPQTKLSGCDLDF